MLNSIFSHVFHGGLVMSYPPEPASRGMQIDGPNFPLWFNGFDVASINFFLDRAKLDFLLGTTTITLLDDPIDRLVRQYYYYYSYYLRLDEYRENPDHIPESFPCFEELATRPGNDNQIVRFFNRMDDEDVVDDSSLAKAINVVSELDIVWFRDTLAADLISSNGPLGSMKSLEIFNRELGREEIEYDVVRLFFADRSDRWYSSKSDANSNSMRQPTPRGARLPATTWKLVSSVNRFDLLLYRETRRRRAGR